MQDDELRRITEQYRNAWDDDFDMVVEDEQSSDEEQEPQPWQAPPAPPQPTPPLMDLWYPPMSDEDRAWHNMETDAELERLQREREERRKRGRDDDSGSEDGDSASEATEDATGKIRTDKDALLAFVSATQRQWKSDLKGFYVFDYMSGTWRLKDSYPTLRNLIMQQEPLLGAYGNCCTKINRLLALAKGYNVVDNNFMNSIDTQSSDGTMAFSNGVYDFLTRKTEPFQADHRVNLHNP
jgi:hypothetical protein